MFLYIKKISKILVIFSVVFVGLLFLLNLIARFSDYQEQFTYSKTTENILTGFYNGKAHILGDADIPWLGKNFDKKDQTGHNIFTPIGARILRYATPFYKKFSTDTEGNTKAYYFKTYVGKGIKDSDVKVIKLDYNSPENPWIIRIILDEIVAVGTDEYLGKIHIRIFGSHYVTIGYFGLKK